MKKNRVIIYVIILLIGFSCLIYRLVDIQLMNTERFGTEKVNLLSESVAQRASQITVSDGRGKIIDRYGTELNMKSNLDVVLFPFVKDVSGIRNVMLDTLQISSEEWEGWFDKAEEPFYLTERWEQVDESLYEKLQSYHLPGVVPVERQTPVKTEPASHLIGLTGSSKKGFQKRYPDEDFSAVRPYGISGLEAAFDTFLTGEGKKILQYHIDALGNPLLGLNMRVQGEKSSFYPLSVKTTLDSKLQKKIESIIDQSTLKEGGMVLLDIKTREILAMVSRPAISYGSLYDENKSLRNRMLSSHIPGSIFKIVSAAAAIENYPQALLETYNCDNNVYGTDEAERKLGQLTFEESFAESCNFAFAEIGRKLQKLDPEIIADYASKLGLLDYAGWSGEVFKHQDFQQLPEEEKGNVWGDKSDRFVAKAISQTAIGQKNVRISPLAAANLMATIANDGMSKQVKAVNSFTYKNGTTLFEFKNEATQQISPLTAKKLQQLLAEVVETGTGKSLQGLSIAGKSGTAEIGKPGTCHYWFAGYFPVNEPKYAMVVADLFQSPADQANYLLFKELTKVITEHEPGVDKQ
ncbi:peptidoglycan D,D-transpeptidase FtsI family protein [Thalassobacillus pellis]|uniref:peptidoglycan D,D-transpeptidase FtsI family protein n=1 Tax=Thalassobacillus pellis TaxID=748008 RepID=UPI001960870D|nr:penicillin-binding transpeptidase domain-containing protein [Thalassobacillus pellis]MBM7554677.1 cell division protein FtsI/penicillin-binding protein 2 [Thalassobacillus pellis]